MYKGNNRSIVKQAARAGSHSEFCAICGVCVVYSRGAVCQTCVAKTAKLMQCGKEHNVVTRIINGRSACVMEGEVVHRGRGCDGCRFEST